MKNLSVVMMFLSLTLLAAIFGFFYAWICSTMWGLDQADPRVAIPAMQAMNASVRNWVFAPAFFGPPLVLGLTAWLLWRLREGRSAAIFFLSLIVYLVFGLLLTATVNVPMNEALAVETVPDDIGAASVLWRDYSQRWQFWNQTRTVASGLAFLLALAGVFLLRRKPV